MTAHSFDDLLDIAGRFTLTRDEAARIGFDGHRWHDLQIAMVKHIYTEKARECRAAFGWVLLPTWVETRLGRAWDAVGSEFMAIAEREYEAATSQVAA